MVNTGYATHMTDYINHLISKNYSRVVLRVLFLFALVLICLSNSTANAVESSEDNNNRPVVVAEAIPVYVKAIVFNDIEFDTLALVDFPFTLLRDKFDFFKQEESDSLYQSRIYVRVTVYGVDGMPVDSTDTYFTVQANSLEDAAREDITLFNRLSVLLPVGIYSARLIVTDVVNKRTGDAFIDQVIVEPTPENRMYITGTCLAYSIRDAGERSDGRRTILNGLQVLTNPLSAFVRKDSSAYLYAELHNLRVSLSDSASYHIGLALLDDSGVVIQSLLEQEIQAFASGVVVAERFNIADLPSGKSNLRFVATDLNSSVSDTVALTIHVLEKKLDVVASGGAGSLADPYDTLSLIAKERLVTYMLSANERKTLKRLSKLGELNFLEQFWRERDSDPRTKIIENRLEMIERYNFCNRFFSTNLKRDDGWSTARGRVYMLYGPWDQQDDISSPVVGNPFLVWRYFSIRQGVVFVFEDRQGFDDYILVHSTLDGEVYSKEWRNRIEGDYYLRSE